MEITNQRTPRPVPPQGWANGVREVIYLGFKLALCKQRLG
jgi:hypothetical protein